MDKISLSDNVLSQLKTDIIKGKLKPGEKLKLSDLKVRYNTGNSPIREALYQLINSGLVYNESQKGFHVTNVSIEDLKDKYLARISIELIALELSIKNGHDAWESNIVSTYYQLNKIEKNSHNYSLDDWDTCHKNFHLSLFAACPSKQLVNIVDQLFLVTSRYRYIWYEYAKNNKIGLRLNNNDHNKLKTAALNKDIDKAKDYLMCHYDGLTERLCNIL